MASRDDDEKELAALTELHRKGLMENPIVGPPEVKILDGKPQDFTDLLTETVESYTPSDYLKKLPL